MSRNRLFTPRRTLLASAVLAALGGTPHAWGQVLELSALNSANGFKLSGVAANDRSGYAVSRLGDVNGDSGASCVVFGSTALNAPARGARNHAPQSHRALRCSR